MLKLQSVVNDYFIIIMYYRSEKINSSQEAKNYGPTEKQIIFLSAVCNDGAIEDRKVHQVAHAHYCAFILNKKTEFNKFMNKYYSVYEC